MRADYAQAYRELYGTHWWWRAREEFLVDTLRRRLARPQGNRILDVGCGSGLFFDRLAEFGEVSGVEVDTTMKTGNPDVDGRIVWGTLDRFEPAGQFSVVLLLDVLEHLPDPAATLRRAVSLLSQDGTLVATVPAFRLLWTRHDDVNEHITRYTKRSFRMLLESAGCRVELLHYFFAWMFPAKLAVRAVEKLRPSGPGSNELPDVPPGPINRALYRLSRLEQASLGSAAPVGSSLLAVGRKGAPDLAAVQASR
jgi:SAM-dependent methyltransferase